MWRSSREKARAVTVLDRDQSNSPERRTRTEVFFILRTLVLKFRHFGIFHSQNPSKFTFISHLIKLMMLIQRGYSPRARSAVKQVKDNWVNGFWQMVEWRKQVMDKWKSESEC